MTLFCKDHTMIAVIFLMLTCLCISVYMTFSVVIQRHPTALARKRVIFLPEREECVRSGLLQQRRWAPNPPSHHAASARIKPGFCSTGGEDSDCK